MQLLFEFLMVVGMSWWIFQFVGARGGSPWFWASLSAAGYFILELSVCYVAGARPSEYFLNWFPGAGIMWLMLVGFVARIRFRGRAVKTNP